MLRAFKTLNLSGYAIQTFQRNVQEFTAQLSSPLLSGNIVEVAVTSGSNTINHGLGRPVSGFFIVDSNADVRLWRLPANQTTPIATIVLEANTTANVKINFF